MIVTIEDLEVLEEVRQYLIENDYNGDLYVRYYEVLQRIKDKRKKHASKQNNWNKEHREYHRLTNNIAYNKKIGNDKKVEELREKLKEVK